MWKKLGVVKHTGSYMVAHCYNDSWLCFQGPEQQSSADLSQPALDPTNTHTHTFI